MKEPSPKNRESMDNGTDDKLLESIAEAYSWDRVRSSGATARN